MTVRRSGYWFTVAVVMLALAAIFYGPSSSPECQLSLNSGIPSHPFPRHCISLEVVNTPATREQGLSTRKSIDVNKGMLFVFDKPQLACMWMKDMRFPIDMVWLNDKKRIVKTERGVSPDTFPAVFCAPDTKYVLELAPGTVFVADMQIGQRLNF